MVAQLQVVLTRDEGCVGPFELAVSDVLEADNTNPIIRVVR